MSAQSLAYNGHEQRTSVSPCDGTDVDYDAKVVGCLVVGPAPLRRLPIDLAQEHLKRALLSTMGRGCSSPLCSRRRLSSLSIGIADVCAGSHHVLALCEVGLLGVVVAKARDEDEGRPA